MAGDVLADARSRKRGRYTLAGWLRHSVFGRLAGYEMGTTPSACARGKAAQRRGDPMPRGGLRPCSRSTSQTGRQERRGSCALRAVASRSVVTGDACSGRHLASVLVRKTRTSMPGSGDPGLMIGRASGRKSRAERNGPSSRHRRGSTSRSQRRRWRPRRKSARSRLDARDVRSIHGE